MFYAINAITYWKRTITFYIDFLFCEIFCQHDLLNLNVINISFWNIENDSQKTVLKFIDINYPINQFKKIFKNHIQVKWCVEFHIRLKNS